MRENIGRKNYWWNKSVKIGQPLRWQQVQMAARQVSEVIEIFKPPKYKVGHLLRVKVEDGFEHAQHPAKTVHKINMEFSSNI